MSGADRHVPAPGAPVRGSRSGRPVMALLDLLGRRWALRVLWELREGPVAFRALQQRCDGMSSSVLNQRLAELRAAEVVELSDAGYGLTAEGVRLLEGLEPLQGWAERWAARSGKGPARADRAPSASRR
jgi:DNA-binding HxlR family transcriptional regulator